MIKKSLKELKELRLEVVGKMVDLATAGFGLVAALAWNDAIKAIFDSIFPKSGSIAVQIIYAVLITIIVVLVTIRLGRMVNVAKQEVDEATVKEEKKS